MASCRTCKKTILWGGIKKDGGRYCNSECMEKDGLGRIADRIPDSAVKTEANIIRRMMCPECNQENLNVEMRFSHRAISYIILTSWSKNSILSCSSCHRKKVLGDTIITFFFGWWGFPFGLIVTPMQILRNISAALSSNSPSTEPSSELCSFVRTILAQKMIENSYQQVTLDNEISNTNKMASLKRDTPPPLPKRMKRPLPKPNVPR